MNAETMTPEVGSKRLRIGAAMVVLGVVLGPLYGGYSRYFTGVEVGAYAVLEQKSKWTLSDGTVRAFPSGRAARPIGLDLEPAMNPVIINWSGSAYDPVVGSVQTNQYLAWLFLRGNIVAMEGFSFDRHREETVGRIWWARTWLPIAVINVSQAGHYDFVLEEPRRNPFTVQNMRIEVRRNATPAIALVNQGGWALMAAGALTLVIPWLLQLAGPARLRRGMFLGGVGVALGVAFLVLLYFYG